MNRLSLAIFATLVAAFAVGWIANSRAAHDPEPPCPSIEGCPR